MKAAPSEWKHKTAGQHLSGCCPTTPGPCSLGLPRLCFFFPWGKMNRRVCAWMGMATEVVGPESSQGPRLQQPPAAPRAWLGFNFLC